MSALLVLLGVLVLIAIVVGASDRFVAVEAERRASEYLAAPLGPTAKVRVHGSSFVAQALRGRYRHVEVTASELRVGVLEGTTLRAYLSNAYLPLRSLVGRRVSELPVENVHGDLLIPYRELARASRIPGLRFSYRSDRLIATAKLSVPGVSTLARVSGEAVPTIADASGVSVRVRNLSVAGFAVPGIVLGQLAPALAFVIPLPRLPYGLRIEQLTPTPDGLEVSGSAQAVVFRRQGDPVA